MSTLNERIVTVTTESPAETEELACLIGERCSGDEVIALVGELGAGKTRFVKGLARGLGIDPTGVTSPTFVLHQRHIGRTLRLEHVDAYRLTAPSDWHALDLESILRSDSVVVVEWADRIAAVLSFDRLEIAIELEPGQCRRLQLHARGERHISLIASLTDERQTPGTAGP